MTYAGTNKGGTAAIVAAERLVTRNRVAAFRDGTSIPPEQVIATFRASLDRIMGEAGLWDETLAAYAFLQAGGDYAEAVHLLRAHRSTLPRLAVSEPVDARSMQILRRIVPAHRSPDGPQLLGATVDYTARILRRPGEGDPLPIVDDISAQQPPEYADEPFQRYSDFLRERDLLAPHEPHDDPEPIDLALNPPALPAPRSALLSAMSLAETGGLVGMWYRSILGPDGYADESVTLGEVRHGTVALDVTHPHTGKPVRIGSLRVSETECFSHLDERGEDPSRFQAGYGMALGHNERKTIAMANMDLAATRYAGTDEGDSLQQLIMLTTDGLASNGFLEHLKLPHYVTFRSMLDRALAARAEQQPAQQAPQQPELTDQAGDLDDVRDIQKVGQPA
ncbi:phosphonate metabolism protein PhnI [Epidermidibacterium keratini]|uniref:Phosphonate metabolism protein PhnI n=1 Tax=Epidermidibacterium keratini TaxID=1891644 RepID=A0A7M3T4Z9_9ACTN|nr:carbon-phosphorus lyase complex subunit PhnI [Epidermidibacterium keratini]QHB98845.1 phosphonate metabolism protein PhnI [Epidermidibacterium keratini]